MKILLKKLLYSVRVMLRFNNFVPLLGAVLFGSAIGGGWIASILLMSIWTGIVLWDEKSKGNL